MNWLAMALALFGGSEAEDRAAVASVIAEFNNAVKVNDFEKMERLFTPESRQEVANLRDLPPKRLPFDERTALVMKIDRVRFVKPDRAEVEATQSDFAPTLNWRREWACTFALTKTKAGWRIVTYHETERTSGPQ